jgi:hypothetical protein
MTDARDVIADALASVSHSDRNGDDVAVWTDALRRDRVVAALEAAGMLKVRANPDLVIEP